MIKLQIKMQVKLQKAHVEFLFLEILKQSYAKAVGGP